MSISKSYKSYAKINIALKVTGTLPGGFHSLEMVNLPLSLCDDVFVTVESGGCRTVVKCEAIGDLPMEKNICYKAIEFLRSKYNFSDSVFIEIHKNIPFEAGLGGGSSNAAVTLHAVNELLKLGASNDELSSIGLKLGSDVPYFIEPKPAKLEGKGEIVTPLTCHHDFYCLLVKPPFGMSTKTVYSICDDFEKENIDIDGVVSALHSGDDIRLALFIGNDLQKAACSLGPEINEIIKILKDKGVKISNMTGSGSTVFGLSNDLESLKNAQKYMKPEYKTIICKTL